MNESFCFFLLIRLNKIRESNGEYNSQFNNLKFSSYINRRNVLNSNHGRTSIIVREDQKRKTVKLKVNQ